MPELNYPIIYSKRRTISIIIKNGQVEVRAPKRADGEQINRFVQSKQAWIKKHLEKHRQRQIPKKQFLEGERFLFLGTEYPLKISNNYFSRLKFEQGNFLLPESGRRQAKDLFEAWYRGQAGEILARRCDYYSGLMGVRHKRITVTGAKTRWGSCSRKNSVNFSWRLILAPLEIADCVVVHELAHIKYHNHSQNFWNFVASAYPQHRQAKKWLNANGHSLTF